MQSKTIFKVLLLLSFIFITVASVYADDVRVIHEKTFQTEMGKSFKLNTSSGDVYISTWDKPEVYVKISGNKKAHDKMKFRFDKDNNGVTIEGKRDSWFSWFNWNNVYVKYEVKLPANYNANISTAGGDIKIYDIKGTINFETSGGDIFVKNSEGVVHSSTSGGDITIEMSKGKLDLSTSGGDIHAKKFDGDLSVSTSGGDIVLEGQNGKVNASTSGGDINLTYLAVNKGIDLSTTGGDIYVKVQSDFSANADLSTTGGDVTCDLPITSKGKITASRIRGEINGGGPSMECSTTGGDIKVTK
ncbi:MAG: DUF4097 family beta strand repeat-containing protein [Ignavibacteriales bacterium]|nr:DUF4097 family beta strand repeat-containing protein [Ignavibacteriales bacterium]